MNHLTENDPIYCFNGEECIYSSCPNFEQKINTCKFIYLGWLKDSTPSTPTQPTPTKVRGSGKQLDEGVTPIRDLKVGDVSSKDHKITVSGKLAFDAQSRDIQKRDGNVGTVADIVLTDGTGQLKVSAWDEKAPLFTGYLKGESVVIENLYKVKEIYGGVLQADAGKYFKIRKV